MTEWAPPEGKQIGNSTVEVITESEVPSNSWSGIGGIGNVQSLWTEVNTVSRKQCVEPVWIYFEESTSSMHATVLLQTVCNALV